MATRKSRSSSKKGVSSSSIDILKTINQATSSRTPKLGSPGDLTGLSLGSQSSVRPLEFGTPSNKGTTSSSSSKSSNSWTSLLGSISTGGVSDLIGGGGLLSAGLDYLSNGFASLFGGSTITAAPLTRFELPDSQDQSISINHAPATTSGTTTSGLYNSSQPSQLSQTSKVQIVQTVKNALLTSSSLNDVIGEL